MSNTLRFEASTLKDASPRRLELLANLLLKEAKLDAVEDPSSKSDEILWLDRQYPVEQLDLPQEGAPTSGIYGDGIDWSEIEAAGIHWDHGARIRTSGDGYYNPQGNGAHISSALSGMLRAGNDLRSIEGFNEALS